MCKLAFNFTASLTSKVEIRPRASVPIINEKTNWSKLVFAFLLVSSGDGVYGRFYAKLCVQISVQFYSQLYVKVEVPPGANVPLINETKKLSKLVGAFLLVSSGDDW